MTHVSCLEIGQSFLSLQVLIIGGGDGGVLREVVKNPLVESVVLCEIDEVRGGGFSSLKTTLLFQCRIRVMHIHTDNYDVV